MKSKLNQIITLALVLFFTGTSLEELKAEVQNASKVGQCGSTNKESKVGTAKSDSVASKGCVFEGSVTKEEAKGLQFMYQEEKMARDVYAYLYEQYQMRVFGNITKSETMHMSAVAGLMKGADIDNQCSGEAGKFSIKEIQDLYDQLISKGDVSLKDALEVGVMIEEKDIADLEAEIASATNESIKQVYTNLLNASNRHLQAFNRNLERR